MAMRLSTLSEGLLEVSTLVLVLTVDRDFFSKHFIICFLLLSY